VPTIGFVYMLCLANVDEELSVCEGIDGQVQSVEELLMDDVVERE